MGATAIADDTKLAAGVTQYFTPASVTVTVAGVTLSSPQIEAAIQSRVTARNATTTAKSALSKAVSDCDATLASTRPIIAAVRQIALIMYANQPAVLTTFGLAPRKVPAPLTLEEKAARAAKAKATRVARNTMGPKAKAKVKGAATASTPVASGAAAGAAVPITPSATGTTHS